ncbi:hypothetical protein [Halalkalibaculum sp. DA384]|uniref:hypothetical protein n=1 Tax=Halalkalibaculum sp. DA384 TaxID=3373606 RepID=UPI0037553FB1
MKATMDDISRKEHLLAEKAQDILEHQQQLELLESQKGELQQQKPTADKQQLSYQESLEFREHIKQYEKNLKRIEVQIQKLTRELNALKKQAKKLLPVSGVKVKVSTHSTGDVQSPTYCIKHITEDGSNESNDHFEIERLQ